MIARHALHLLCWGCILYVDLAVAQPALAPPSLPPTPEQPAPIQTANPAPTENTAAPPAAASPAELPPAESTAPAPSPTPVLPTPNPTATATPTNTHPGPLAPASPQSQPPAPPPISASISLQPSLPEQRQVQHDDRWFTLGVGPLLLGNFHWLDRPKDRAVVVGKSHGTDDQYPGFFGLDGTLGLMLDLRFGHLIGVEVDLFRQSDRGTGTIAFKDAGSICYIPSVAIPYTTERFRVTIGQNAWHVPILLKLSMVGHAKVVRATDKDKDWRIPYSFLTMAFGPELVFPGSATLEVSPENGLTYPLFATSSTYVMYTGALGVERRILDSYDIRLLVSLRGSYNPSVGSAVMKRADYAVIDSTIEPIAYKSEWRYQGSLTLGLGWFI